MNGTLIFFQGDSVAMTLIQPDPRIEYQTISPSDQYPIIYGDFILSLALNNYYTRLVKKILRLKSLSYHVSEA